MKNEMPSIEKLCKDTRIAIPLACMFRPDQAASVIELHQKASAMKKQIELFCQRFSDYGWCAYDHMKMSVIELANKKFEESGIEAAEEVLIDFYTNEAKEWTNRIIYCDEAFTIREDLLRHYFNEHFAGNYYASIPMALLIVDGAVNDYTKSKGFFADGTEVDAWDCLVGCDDALVKVQVIFRKSRQKTNSEPITMPYRNGILHGRDINFANERVACKCLMLMFAVAEWMNMKNSEDSRRAKFEKENNPPPIQESLQKLQQAREDRAIINQWIRKDIHIGTDIPETGEVIEYSQYPYVLTVVEMFEAWKQRNYGRLGEKLSLLFADCTTSGKRAGACRVFFENKKLERFRIVSVKEEGCCMTEVEIHVDWITTGKLCAGTLRFGCVYENESGIAFPWRNNGMWKLYPRDVKALYMADS